MRSSSLGSLVNGAAFGNHRVNPLTKTWHVRSRVQPPGPHTRTGTEGRSVRTGDVWELGLEGPVFTQESSVESLTKLLQRGMETDGNNLSVSQTRHLAQAILQLVREMSQSAVATLDLTEEEAVRDFMVDRIMLEGDVLQALSMAALVSDRRLADMDGLRLNCLSICLP